MCREKAAIALAIVSAKSEGHFGEHKAHIINQR
jgi:hypothetical protein